ncbi:uncharacterized protein LOC124355723 [Homalodisca vitripennis]|uniref:uncharacterized protein LOC124355723 n=1 Tax=Homalodisca vitripennis TaxID=197043 RepID=UPI001EEC6C0F|nr:uncharacterized protein LOC124355723 [Homalodisca vitripennis]
MEQYSRVNNIEISGLPATKDESGDDLVKDVGAAIGVEVLVGDISAAHRVPSFRKDRDPALVVQFVNRTKKEEWITKYRMKKPSLTAQQVNQRFPSQRVYINDHLSPENKQLLSKLKQKCREIGYTYAWCRDAKYFARKAPGDPVKEISNFEDIDKLK